MMFPMTTTQLPTWELHHRLSRALEWGDVSPEEMAAALGVHVNSVHNYSTGRRTPKLGFVDVWARRTGVPLDWLLGDEGQDAAKRVVTLGYTRPFHSDLVAA